MTPTKPPPRPCECGCGEMLHQRARGTKQSQRRFWSDVCAERVRKAKEAEAEAQRYVWRVKAQARRDAKKAA